MNQIYLVCTRSAISASALTYIINQSPQFYNIVHKNLFLQEDGDHFDTAKIIEDWWNVPSMFSAYNPDVRNNENIKLETLQNLCNEWQKLQTGKHIAFFTHATNTADIMKWRDEHNLPITVVTTIMGNNCYKYMDLFLKREYNDEMNEFINLFEAWKHLYNQFLAQDTMWSEHADVVLAMDDWLDNPSVVYHALNIFPNNNVQTWIDEYKVDNQYHEWDIKVNDVTNKLKTMCYIYGKYESLFHSNQARKLFALSVLESVRSQHNHRLTDIHQVVNLTENIIRKSLTLA